MRTILCFQRGYIKLTLFALVVGIFIAAAGTVAMANPIAYYIDSASFFGTIDLATGTETVVSRTMSGMEGLGEANGVLYTVNNGNAILYSINTGTGAVTEVGNETGTWVYAAFGSTTSGLYAIASQYGGSDLTWYLLSINPSTGAATQIGSGFSTTLGNQSGSGIHYALSAGSSVLYGVGYESSSFDFQLYTFDLNGGIPTAVGSSYSPGTYSTDATGFIGGSLYIITGGEVIGTVNTSSGAPTLTTATVPYTVSGLAPYPVPGAAAAPGSPTGVSATASNAQATVTFSAPTSTGGSPITGYTVTSIPAGGTDTNAGSTSLSHTVTGLTNGNAYTFTVTAKNAIGTSPASAPSNQVTPGILPGAPTNVTATAGNAQATVNFKLPTNGTGSITSCTVTSNPGSVTVSQAGSPIVVSPLINGTPYTFTVTAKNATGTGPASSPSKSVTPVGPPGAPTIVSVKAGNAEATVNFTAPASNGGEGITSYTVTSNPGGEKSSGKGTSITVKGLTNGTPYTFTVTATNKLGTGPASAPSSPAVIPATVPGAPTGVTATAGNEEATVTFTAPASGGESITGYTVTSIPAGGVDTNAGTTSTTHTVTGLTNGKTYTFTVKATNGIGSGPASKHSNSVKPAAVPDAPTIENVTAGIDEATVSFTLPVSDDGGDPVTSYTVTPYIGNSPGPKTSGLHSPITVTGLTGGTAYTFTVTATNAIGTGPASSASNSVTPEQSPPFSGTWNGNWASYNTGESYSNGTFTAAITQSGSSLSGKLNVYGSSCGSLQKTTLSGTVSGNSAEFDASVTCGGSVNKLQYTTGVISGNELSGTWTLYSNGAYHDSGTFSMSKD